MITNKHELAQLISEAVMKQFSNLKSDFNAETVASTIYDVLLDENRANMPIHEPVPTWDSTPEQIIDERDKQANIEWDTDCTLNILYSFIEQNTSQKDFKNHVDSVAKADILALSASQMKEIVADTTNS